MAKARRSSSTCHTNPCKAWHHHRDQQVTLRYSRRLSISNSFSYRSRGLYKRFNLPAPSCSAVVALVPALVTYRGMTSLLPTRANLPPFPHASLKIPRVWSHKSLTRESDRSLFRSLYSRNLRAVESPHPGAAGVGERSGSLLTYPAFSEPPLLLPSAACQGKTGSRWQRRSVAHGESGSHPSVGVGGFGIPFSH